MSKNSVVCSQCNGQFDKDSEILSVVRGDERCFICKECAIKAKLQTKCSSCDRIIEAKDIFSSRVATSTTQAFVCSSCRNAHHGQANDSKGGSSMIESLRKNIMTPKQIVEELNKVVIGQEEAKRHLSVEIYNHYLRIINRDKLEQQGKKLVKNNILLTGLSGTGKTLLAQTLAEMLGVPFAIADATALTESGYVGNDVESILSSLLIKSDMDVEKAELGIVYIDEIDKIAKKGENLSITRDVSGEGVQQALLKLVEGAEVGVPRNGGRINPNQQLININTKNILFICGGAFVGIEDIVKDRLGIKDEKKYSIGFEAEPSKIEKDDSIVEGIRKSISTEDLRKYGLIPELLGRFPIVANLNPLTKEDLIEIINNNNGNIDEYKTLADLQGIELVFSNEAIEKMAQLAIEKKTGARGVKSILGATMRDIMFEMPDMIEGTTINIGADSIVDNSIIQEMEEDTRICV